MTARWLPLATFLIAATAQAAPPPELTVRRTEVVELRIRPLTASDADRDKTLNLRIDSPDGARGSLRFEWPEPGRTCVAAVEARDAVGSLAEDHSVTIGVVLELDDGTRVASDRTLRIRGDSTALFEIYREGESSLTLSVEARIDTRTTYLARPEVTRPVGIRLAVERLDGDRAIPLETNALQTFLGLPVAYAFDLGGTEDDDAIRIRFTPQSIAGGVVTLDVAFEGRLGTPAGPEWTGRTQRIVTTSGTTTAVPVQAGDPPVGYRFLVTPQF